MKNSGVAWTHDTQNFWQGCNEVSAECQGCYAREMMEQHRQNFHVLRLTQTWQEPYRLNAAAALRQCCAFDFCCSMSDFWHPDADKWRDQAWDVIRNCTNIVWLMLTKRPERLKDHLPEDWEQNFNHVWLGTTCGARSSFGRVKMLRQIPCSRRFLSVEPLLEDISDIDLDSIDWILVGGMSGELWEKKRMKMAWAASLYDRTRDTHTRFFWKQVAAPENEVGSNALGLFLAERENRIVDPATVDLVREYPATALPLMPLDRQKGRRFTAAEWTKYKDVIK